MGDSRESAQDALGQVSEQGPVVHLMKVEFLCDDVELDERGLPILIDRNVPRHEVEME